MITIYNQTRTQQHTGTHKREGKETKIKIKTRDQQTFI